MGESNSSTSRTGHLASSRQIVPPVRKKQRPISRNRTCAHTCLYSNARLMSHLLSLFKTRTQCKRRTKAPNASHERSSKSNSYRKVSPKKLQEGLKHVHLCIPVHTCAYLCTMLHPQAQPRGDGDGPDALLGEPLPLGLSGKSLGLSNTRFGSALEVLKSP